MSLSNNSAPDVPKFAFKAKISLLRWGKACKLWHWVLVGIVALLMIMSQWWQGGMVWADGQNFRGGTIPTKTPIGGVSENGRITPVASAVGQPLSPAGVISLTETASVTDLANGLTGRDAFGWGGVFAAGVMVFAGGAWLFFRRGWK